MDAPRACALLIAALAAVLLTAATPAAAWRAETIATAAPVEGIETIDGETRITTAAGWLRLVIGDRDVRVAPADPPHFPPLPAGALPDGRVSFGKKDIARAWFADPTTRYDHGILGDAIEAGSLVVEMRGGHRTAIELSRDAVFEDLTPRIADLEGDGHEEIVTVKSSLRKGSALAIIGSRHGHLGILAETPPLGAAHRWLNPAGIADFTGDGRVDIAAVVMPHAVGRLELWTWRSSHLQRVHAIGNAANHVVGTRAQAMSAVADFDGDHVADLAVPSFDRRRLRLISFKPKPHNIAAVPLPGRAATNLALIDLHGGPALLLGLEDGRLVLVRK